MSRRGGGVLLVVHACVAWLLYRVDGAAHVPEVTLDLEGYRGSRPVRAGNAASEQLQLDVYGDLLDTIFAHTEGGGAIDPFMPSEVAELADFVCEIWRRRDSGIWEVRLPPAHYTHSKAMCWVALDRALRLAERGRISSSPAPRWRREAAAIRDFVETQCWSERLQSYVRTAGNDDVDASLLLLGTMEYADARSERFSRTLQRVRAELGAGPLLYRYRSQDGLPGTEGAFLPCSFWLVQALVLAGRLDEAAGIMESSLGLANDVGLYAEEIDPASGDFLGNFPQALVHLALVNAAAAFARAAAGRESAAPARRAARRGGAAAA
jgi:GH15 family glucan-1,4-alpha-glucosidase